MRLKMCNVTNLVKKILSVPTCFIFLSETECPNDHNLGSEICNFKGSR